MNSSYKYKISVIIVCHPAFDILLRKAVKSLSDQTFDDFEIIIIWNGYIQHPQERYQKLLLCENLVSRTSYGTCNGSLATACNRGIKMSQGEYIIRLDADDQFDLEILNKEFQVFKRNGYQIDAVWCDFWRTYSVGNYKFDYQYQTLPELEHACGVLYRRTVFDALGGYDESLQYQESFDFWHRFKSAGLKAFHLKKALYYYRQHRNSMSTNTANRNQARINILMDCK